MQYIPEDFRTALELDMARHNMLERDLGARIGVSQQSISKWKARNFPPLYRVKDLLAVLGPDSYVAKLDLPNRLAQTPRLRITEPGTEPTHVSRAPKFPTTEHLAAVRQVGVNVIVHDLEAALPGALKEYAGAEGPSFRGKALKTEYHSPNLVVFVKPGVSHSAHAATGVLTLAAAKAALSCLPNPQQFIMAFVLCPGVPADDVVHASTLHCAEALGVQVWVCGTMQELATRIEHTEGALLSATHTSEYDAMGDLLS